MPRTCTICSHKNRKQIDEAIASGESLRDIAGRYSLTKSSVARHKDDCLSPALIQAKQVETAHDAMDIIQNMKYLCETTNSILEAAIRDDDKRIALSAIKEARGNNELISKLIGQLPAQDVQRTIIFVYPPGVQQQ